MKSVLLTGATGFVGSALYPVLNARGYRVRCASRDPERARALQPEREWTAIDVERPGTLPRALAGIDIAYYLVHGMSADRRAGDYELREERSARNFAEAAHAAGVQRIIYLGGVAPSGQPSKHLRSRLRTGALLRQGPVPAVELRAGMIVGRGSESWQIVRDLSMRLPVMVLPAWLRNLSQPVAIDDVVAALAHACTIPNCECDCYSLPGPETLSGRQLLDRVASLRGMRPVSLNVSFVSPRLSSYWIKWVTRADVRVARELVEGLTSDLVAHEPSYWGLMPGHTLMPFEEAARRALAEDTDDLSLSAIGVERMVRRIAPKATPPLAR
jgi:uncharacterized protein YbjT (DUF2867 family)